MQTATRDSMEISFDLVSQQKECEPLIELDKVVCFKKEKIADL